MKIVVCVKRVPDSATPKLKIAQDGKRIDPAGIEFKLSPYDAFAVEQALQLKEKAGQGEVVALTVGPPESLAMLQSVLAMGADRAILVKDPAPCRDPYGTAEALAAVLKTVPFDMVWFGRQAIDGDAHQVGVLVAQRLGLPVASVVVKFELAGGSAIVHRQIEGGAEVVEVKLPAVFTAQKGLNEPRHTSLKGIMAAKKKPIEEREMPPVQERLELLSLAEPPSRPAGRIVGEGAGAVPELVRLLKTEAKVL